MKLLEYRWSKRFLMGTFFKVLTWINKCCTHDKKIILIHINDEFRDNNKYLFEYLIENEYNHSYKIICSCGNPQDYSSLHIDNVRFTNVVGGIKAFFSAGNVFYSIGRIPIEPGKNQTVMQMWHGIPLKKLNAYKLWVWKHYTWFLSPSKHFAQLFSKMGSIPEDRIFIGGYPRCDAMFKGNPNYDFGEYDKIILWAPTFRKSTNAQFDQFVNCRTMLPILQLEDYADFDYFLTSINVKVVVKLHPLQYLYEQKIPIMKNLILMSHSDFTILEIDLYRFLAQCDALITDYSSIYFDYLLLDRPTAFTEDDVDEYTSERGFAMDNPDAYKPGTRIKTKEDLMRFCENLIKGKDDYKNERKRVNELANDYRNGGYSKRILDKMGIVLYK